MSTIVALITDAYGGFGGIAQYNRDFLAAMADSPRVARVIVVPRVASTRIEEVPPGIDHRTQGLSGLAGYGLACAKVMANEQPKLIVCGHVHLLPFAVPMAAHFRIPIALLVYGIDVWTPPRLASRLLLNRVAHLVSISRLTLDKMLTWSDHPLRHPTTIIPNGIDLSRFRTASEKPRYLLDRYGLHDKKVIMTLARLVAFDRYKGVREVLDIMPKLLATDPDITYLVVGDGSDLSDTREHADKVGVSKNVIFAGRIDESEKVDHYRLADAYVMPGRGEGFGFVFLEAMACGIPVVASVLDGSREAVRFGALGELCDPRDPESTVTAIRTALAKGRGEPPVGLDYFGMPNFRRRVHEFVDAFLA